jgi:hypothetical protein
MNLGEIALKLAKNKSEHGEFLQVEHFSKKDIVTLHDRVGRFMVCGQHWPDSLVVSNHYRDEDAMITPLSNISGHWVFDSYYKKKEKDEEAENGK